MKNSLWVIVILTLFSLNTYAAPSRIICLNGALTETVDALGFGKQIVAVDVTSTYPAYVNQLPKVSKNRSVSAEGLLSFSPDLILAPENTVSKEIEYQLQSAGVKLVVFKQQYSYPGSIAFIKAVSVALGVPEKGNALAKEQETKVNAALNKVKQHPTNAKVLFIYARGTGVMMVAGKNTSLDAIINLAGAKNAVSEFSEFKPYTTEALVKANPDAILMFDFGFSSLGGLDAILKLPGMQQTNAGKNKKIIQMDGDLLTNFSTRLDKAITDLNAKL
ncbi:hemin ABC transporter substrate-binding protein [Mucilaginibacter conchicola]|uniref:Hemin ABC transporter substrate-binding protein n=1 Tax=Mucilaginibacter conchicola TaxID=2303333 RepID=A0A372NXK1_9SPHI|nr:ABC transporter substrate-binding protein [Mucilaginibacter conchicola]RFZ94634.1 hemin ABC transporter substrate-binding protein [Mucilaginibacter conchicola]